MWSVCRDHVHISLGINELCVSFTEMLFWLPGEVMDQFQTCWLSTVLDLKHTINPQHDASVPLVVKSHDLKVQKSHKMQKGHSFHQGLPVLEVYFYMKYMYIWFFETFSLVILMWRYLKVSDSTEYKFDYACEISIYLNGAGTLVFSYRYFFFIS
jgi:hypothetical protein